MEPEKRRVLVMGASGVLGSLLARRLQESGAYVIGTARSDTSAQRLAPELDERLLLDLEQAMSRDALVAYLNQQALDGIVNAAGLVGFGAPSQTPAEGAARLMTVNHLGPAEVISGLLPALRASATAGRAPVICGITGVVAERAFPGMSAYVASKTAHAAWLSALRLDLRREGIRVLDTHPGHTETGLAERAAFGVSPKFPKGADPAHVVDVIVEALNGTATEVASSAFSN